MPSLFKGIIYNITISFRPLYRIIENMYYKNALQLGVYKSIKRLWRLSDNKLLLYCIEFN